MMSMRSVSAYSVAAVVGAAGWLGISQITQRREAWDSDLYFSVFFPLAAAVIAILAFLAPERPWRWAFTPFAAQAIVMTLQDPSASLLPLGLIMFGILGAVCMIPANLGAALRRRLGTSGST